MIARLLENVAPVFVEHISTYYAESYDNGPCSLLFVSSYEKQTDQVIIEHFQRASILQFQG